MIYEFNHNTDLDQVMDIWLNTNITAHNFIDKNYWLDNYQLVRDMLPKSDLYIYKIDNEILGFIGLQESYIAGIFVKAKYQRKKVGRELLNYVKNSHTELSLNVYKDNINAVNFYIKNNFSIEKELLDNTNKKIEYYMTWNKKIDS